MATIQIRDIPDDVYETILRRARAAGKSIQSYMRDHVVEFAAQRTKAEAIAAIEAVLDQEPGPGARLEDIIADLHADRR